MRSVVKDLNKYISNYCIAHSDMLDAQANCQSMRSTQTILIYTEAEARLSKAKAALKRRLPPNLLIPEVLAEYSLMIQETCLDPPDDE